MKPFQLTVAQLLAAAACAVSLPATAQAPADHSHHAAPAAPAAAPQAPVAQVPSAAAPAAELAEGEVRRLDLDTGKVTLKHGPIKSLDMPPMTMVFNANKALLGSLKVGDKVRFKAAQEAGKYVVTDIQPAN